MSVLLFRYSVTDDEPDESLNGFITIDDITYYYSNGALLKDTIVGDDSEQFYYVNSEGIIDYGYCDGVTVDGVDWVPGWNRSALVFASNEAQEIIRLCSRALVMYHGDVRAEVSGETMNEANIMRLATGG